MSKEFKHIELFAGCGGMSLGLEAAGFNLYFANELSPMAAETFAYNILGEDLQERIKNNNAAQSVIWIKSKFNSERLRDRLRENPFEYFKGQFGDVNPKIDLDKKLIVGNINHLLEYFNQNPAHCKRIKALDIDLVSGGPPCQGFSLAGKREKNDYKNLLPLSFAKFSGLIQPKFILLENVKGILSPFTQDGIKYYAWLEVAKAFSIEGYVPVCFLVNSKYFGIPQNRPRFILLGIRKDVHKSLLENKNHSEYSQSILIDSLIFYKKVKKHVNELDQLRTSDLKVYDIDSDSDFFDGKLLPKIITEKSNFTSASRAIGDIKSTNKKYSILNLSAGYPALLNYTFKNKFLENDMQLQNHEIRKHSYKVRARFRLYQVVNELNGLKQDATLVISGRCKDEQMIRKV